MPDKLNWNSRRLTTSSNAAITAFLHGLKWSDAEFDRPIIAVGAPELDLNLCNRGSHESAQAVIDGCEEEAIHAYKCGLPGISDNLTQGIEGGRYSLPSRDAIADNFAAMASAHCFDGMIGIHFCDKNFPGLAIALARNNFPGLIFSGGSIYPGQHNGQPTTILSAYDAQAAAQQGALSQEESNKIIRTACPGRGGCGLMATFNTMAMAGEAIGLIPPSSASIHAEDPEKPNDLKRAGQLIKRLIQKDIRPRNILTKQAFENAMKTVVTIGGSTNATLHLLALAHEAGVTFTMKDIQRIARETPVLCNFAPRGSFNMIDLHRIGGTPVLFRHLIRSGILNGDCLTVTGDNLAANYADAPALPPDQELVAPAEAPFKEYADMQVCFGNLAPEGIVFKVSSLQTPEFAGEAICFEKGDQVVDAATAGKIQPGHVVVMRYQGPVGSPGMPELLIASSALSTPQLNGKVALVCDGRVSGVAHGAIGVHCSPEAVVGGPIAAVQDGDRISFNLLKGQIYLHISDQEIADRLQQWEKRPLPAETDPYLKRYAALVSQASQGCILQA
ncbi:MAG: Dihydroxy-acid dehydratase [Verrucomicrobia subdivision 3 bacterium]|nr:Dihydroxy-acid dehydratase [Limisphaerales bacterium]MCS1413585.1 Dihydroxy-acid dehydratase [Limisphaerales bacterium]